MSGGGLAESNSIRFRRPPVFKTELGPAQLTLHILVQPPGIEPDSSRLQRGAMTTSAKVAYWCVVKESNLRLCGVNAGPCH